MALWSDRLHAAGPSLLLMEQVPDLLGAGEQLYALEMREGVVDESPLVLYGQQPLTKPLLTSDGQYVVLSTGYPERGSDSVTQQSWTYTTALEVKPLRLGGAPPYLGETGRRTQVTDLLADSNGEGPPDWLMIASAVLERGRGSAMNAKAASRQGAVVVKPADPESEEIIHPLPGQPIQAIALPNREDATEQIAVLYHRQEDRRLALRIQEAYSGVLEEEYVLHDQLSLPARIDSAAMHMPEDKSKLWVAVSGFDLARTGNAAITWVACLDWGRKQWSRPVQVTGRITGLPHTLYPLPNAQAWLPTKLPGTSFGHVTLLESQDASNTDSHIEKVVQYALTDVDDQILLAPDPNSEDLVVSWGDRFEIWPEGRRSDNKRVQRTLEAPLIQLFHYDDAPWLLTSEALYRYDLAEEALQTVYTANYGALCQVLPLSESTMKRPPSEEDADSLLRLNVRKTQYFRGEAVGRELHELHINPVGPEAADATWRIDYDHDAMPWLRLHPRSGRGPGYVYMGIDPGLYEPDAEHRGVLTLNLEPAAATQRVIGSPAHIVVRIAPPGSPIMRILWVWPESMEQSFRSDADPMKLKALGDLLATTPHFFSHREAAGPFQENLAPYGIVVIGVRALMEGGITRQALLNHVQAGGALLLLGEVLEAESEPILQRWLSSLGIEIFTNTPSAARRNTSDSMTTMLRPWSEELLVEGCLIQTEEAMVEIAADTGEADQDATLLVAGTYGLGRIAVLAGPTPLEREALGEPENRQFAESLFRWLARAGVEAE